MYGYEDKTYNEVLTQAVNNIEEINQAVDAICEKGYKNLYLVGTGGTYAMASPLSYLIKTNSTIPWYYEIAAELVTAKPKQLTKDSVVITASLSGTTVETINAAKYAKEVGATVGKGAVRGGATGALSAVLRIGGKNHGIPVITDSAASTIIAGGIIDTGVSIYAYAQGEISGEQLREDLANTVVKSTVTIYMTKAATLALGGCGAFLPMAVYSVSSYMVACTREIIKNAKLNAEEFLRLTSLLEEETQIVYQQKTALEAQLSQYTDYRLRNMSEFLHRFDDVMQNGGNYDNAIFAIVSYANQTGIVLQHASKTDFDAAMISDNEFILK